MQIGAGLTLSGTTISVAVANSITIAGSGNGSVQLVNDEASPGNTMFYGTNGAGSKGWYSLSDEGVDSITGTAGQVLANGTSGSAQGGAVTLTLATALVSINSVTSAAAQNLVLTANAGATLTLGQGASGVIAMTGLSFNLPSATTSGIQIYNTADQTTNYERLAIRFTSNAARIIQEIGGSGANRSLAIQSSTTHRLEFSNAADGGMTFSYTAGAANFASANGWVNITGPSSMTNTTGTTAYLSIRPTYNQASGDAVNSDFVIRRTETALGSGTQLLIQAGTSVNNNLFTVNNSGGISALLGIGIGTGTLSATTALNIIKAVNNEVVARVENTDTGTGASAAIRVAASGGSMTWGVTSSGFTTAGILLQDGAYMLANSSLSGGLTIGTQTTSSLIFATNDTARGRFTSTGEFIALGGQGWGVTSTATAGGTTTLTTSSTVICIFTGSAAQDCQLPAANAQGAGIAIIYVIKNRSTGLISVLRAGSDTIDGSTSYTILSGDSITIASNGVDTWVVC